MKIWFEQIKTVQHHSHFTLPFYKEHYGKAIPAYSNLSTFPTGKKIISFLSYHNSQLLQHNKSELHWPFLKTFALDQNISICISYLMYSAGQPAGLWPQYLERWVYEPQLKPQLQM